MSGEPQPPQLVDSGRPPGWYWVKAFLMPGWFMAYHDKYRWRVFQGKDRWSTMLQGEPDVVGPRVEEPVAENPHTSTWRSRLLAERAQLVERTEALRAALSNPERFAGFAAEIHEAMTDQLDAMDRYRQALDFCIARLPPEEPVTGQPTSPEPQVGEFVPTKPFHVYLYEVLQRTRSDGTVSLDTMVLMVIGMMHQFVRSAPIRAKAVKAINDVPVGEGYPERYVDAVIASIMSPEN